MTTKVLHQRKDKMKIYDSITDMIGRTPLLRLKGYSKYQNLNNSIIAKLESFNPGGSVKDRIALAMLKAAIEQKKVNQDTLIIEPTSGNTGIGLALVAASYGLKLVIVMPDSMSLERRNLLRAYGVTLELTQGSLGMKGAIKRAQELHLANENSFIPSQFDNKENMNIHYLTTGPEIYADTEGKIDVLVAGVGTGGTISGTGKYLKEKNPDLKIIAVEPARSPFLSKGYTGAHKIQGIGSEFISNNLEVKLLDEIIDVDDTDAFKTAQDLAKYDGVLAGASSGAAVFAASEIAKREEYKAKNIVVVLPDTGERYLSTPVFLK